jgi:spore germination protein
MRRAPGRSAAGGSLLALALVAVPWAAPTRHVQRAALSEGPPPRLFAFVSRLDGAELRRMRSVGLRLDVVAPNWYSLDAAAGTVRGGAGTKAFRTVADRAGVAVWPTVNARTGGSRAWERPRAGARIARALAAVSRGEGAAGVTLDMEELRPRQRGVFTALVRAAAAHVHAGGRRLAVYVPRPGPGSAAAYDWSALAAAADLVLCSGYNEHWAGGPPGPTTTTAGFATVLDRALALAGPAKAVPVLGAFGYRWSSGRGRLVSTTAAGRLRRRAGGAAVRVDGSERFQLGGDVVVYETVAGLRARAAAARAAGARWLGLFSLGREPVTFWAGLATARSVGRAPHRSLQDAE